MNNPIKKERKKCSKIGLTRIVLKILPYLIKTAPFYFIGGCIILIIQSVLQSLQIYLLDDIFSDATELSSGIISIKIMIAHILFYAGTFIVSQCLGWVANYTDIKFNQISSNIQKIDMYKKMSCIEPIDFEDTNVLNDISKANNGIDSTRNVINILKQIFLYHIPYLIIVSVYLIRRETILLGALLLVFLPTIFQYHVSKKIYKTQEDVSAPLRRKKGYFEECITSPTYFKETRMLGAYRTFIDKYKVYSKELVKLDIKSGVKQELSYFATTTVTLIGRLFVYYLLFVFLMRGRISVGEFAAVFASIGSINGKLNSLFYGSLNLLSKELPNVENYTSFLDIREERTSFVDLPRDSEIELKNITFTYPNQIVKAINDVSFKVYPGETVAIVGENGSGKSTLIKLITGYYIPTSGDVTYNDKSTKDMSYASIANHLSAVYQKSPHYPLTLKESLVIGQIHNDIDEDKLRLACSLAGFSPEDDWLPYGFDTMLSREFDNGVELSGGQIQRIAIARAFYRESDIIVLDEPTAAIDPIEESRIYHRFAELTQGKTSFIVTHRLASVKIADKIIVMKDGSVVEIGTHAELISKNGEYKRMYDSQLQWYNS